jgi:hypothetical protein
LAAPVPSVGTIKTCNNDLDLSWKSPTVKPAWSMAAAHWRTTVTAPHYISDDKSEMRGIKPGWYAVEDAGDLTAGPFSSREECVKRITQPTNGTMESKLQRGAH